MPSSRTGIEADAAQARPANQLLQLAHTMNSAWKRMKFRQVQLKRNFSHDSLRLSLDE